MVKRLDQVSRDWHRLGAEDPLWAVLMRPGTKHGQWQVDEFLETGREEVAAALDHLSSLGVEPGHDRALDFGCGAGRVTQALADRFDTVVGVDVSEPMLAKARELDRTDGRCTFVRNTADDLSMFPDDEFDLAYSSLVIQHLPPAEGRRFVSEMARVVRPAGAVIVQVASRPKRNVKGLLFRYAPNSLLRFGQRHVLGYPAPMRMQAVSADDLAASLGHHRVVVLDRVEDRTYGGHWSYHRYFAVKRA